MKQTINGKEYDISPEAYLRGADLTRADLRGANMTEVKFNNNFRKKK